MIGMFILIAIIAIVVGLTYENVCRIKDCVNDISNKIEDMDSPITAQLTPEQFEILVNKMGGNNSKK